MVMNKKEREQFDLAIREAKVNKALRWSDYDTTPDIPSPSSGSGISDYVNGWSYNAHTNRVYKTWSLSFSHGDGWVLPGDRHQHGSQKGIAQFSTKEKALKALRVKVENNHAKDLADIDEMILAEMQSNENP